MSGVPLLDLVISLCDWSLAATEIDEIARDDINTMNRFVTCYQSWETAVYAALLPNRRQTKSRPRSSRIYTGGCPPAYNCGSQKWRGNVAAANS